MVGTEKPKDLVKFYEKVLEKEAKWEGEVWGNFKIGHTYLSIGFHSEVKAKAKQPQRIILNFESEDVKEDFERIKKIEGAEVIKEPYAPIGAQEFLIATFADPDGNYFQLMSPWNDKM